MDPTEQCRKLFLAQWGGKTLEAFRQQAMKEFNGTAFEAIRANTGRRLAIVICATGEHEMSRLARQQSPPADCKPVDWEATRVADVVIGALKSEAIVYLDQRTTENRLTAVMLISADPRSNTRLEQFFGLTP